MATSWLIMLIPYLVPIAILAVLHVLDRRRGFARPASAVLRRRPHEASADGQGRQVA
jgi:hypothetical protein